MKATFVQNQVTLDWIVLNPRRQERPDQHHTSGEPIICPFDPGNEGMTEEVMRVGGNDKSDWQIRVVKNIFPITPYHEVVIDSPHHNSSLITLPLSQVELLFEVYQARYNDLKKHGYPLIFHNHGEEAGESLRHGHSQIAVIPPHVGISSPMAQEPHNIAIKGKALVVFCPEFSVWPYETWIQPLRRDKNFGQIDVAQLTELGSLTQRILKSLDSVHPNLAYNFYIYPGEDWYLRIVGRSTKWAGFEIGSGIPVNVVDPKEVVAILS